MTDMVTFTPAKLAELKRAYADARNEGYVSFMFEGRELLVSYAKYMIEYLEERFNATQSN